MYRFSLARPEDDAALRAVLAATPMPGKIRVAFRRAPSFFGGALVEGRFHQALAARESASGAIVAIGARSTMPRFVNAAPREIGYLSGLRILPAHRHRQLIARGYAFLRELHGDARTVGYLTTIADDNAPALGLLTSRRAGLPAYHPLGEYRTLAIPLRTRWRPRRSPDLHIRPARRENLPQILDFLARQGSTRQFFPCYQATDFFTQDGLLRGLAPEDLLLAFRGPELVGTLGAWDQQAFRQTVIDGYSGFLQHLRPLYNMLAGPLGRPRLPAPGHPVRALIGALPVATDECALAALLAAVLDLRRDSAHDYLLLAFAADDPLQAALHRAPARSYLTRLFYVCWDDGDALRASLDSRPFYLELGSL